MKIDHPRKWYVADYENSEEFTTIGEYEVPLPVRPPMDEMENFGKRKRHQVFNRVKVPVDIHQWEERDRELFIRREFHRRKHGIWIIVKGSPVYITGQAYVFFNYWYTESGPLPTFRMEAVEFFLLWKYADMNEDCYGLIDIKARRIGDTEKAIFLAWEYATRIRRSWSGMQNTTKEDAKENFDRIKQAHRKMPFFFVPKSKGSTDPNVALEFKYPEERLTRKSIRENSDEDDVYIDYEDRLIKPMNSRIDYRATREKVYDGKRITYYHLDEPGKITEMNVLKQWGIVKHCLHLQNGRKIIGKAMMTTTVEEFKNGETMARARKLWDGASPHSIDSNGRTVNGMIRIFRSALLGAETDRWGFHKMEEARELIEEERDRLIKKGWLDEYVDLCRRQPLEIDDVFRTPPGDCALNPGLLDYKINQLTKGYDALGRPIAEPLRYNLIWTNGYGSDVEAIEDANGPWVIKQMPVRKNHKEMSGGRILPGNRRIYSCGCDPVDHRSPEGKRSQFALAIFRNFDIAAEQSVHVDTNGEVLDSDVQTMQTDQFVCTYVDRPDDPHTAYEAALKTAMFYGVPIYAEINKPGIVNHLGYIEQGKYSQYLYGKPPTLTASKTTQRQDTPGSSATTKLINSYVDLLLHHIKRRIDTYTMIHILKDYRRFTVKNRTDCDLTVAAGFALLVAYDSISKDISDRSESRYVSLDDLFSTYNQAA